MRRTLAAALAGVGRRVVPRSCLSGASPSCAARSTAWHAHASAVPSSGHFAHASAAASGSEPFAGRPRSDAGGKPGGSTHRASGAGAMRGFVAINKRIIQCVDGTHASAPPANRFGRDVFPKRATNRFFGRRVRSDDRFARHSWTFVSPRTTADALLAVVAREWREMNTVNVATAWHRLAKLARLSRKQKQKRGPPRFDARADPRMQILERLARENVDTFDAMNLANVVWSLAVLDHHAFASSGRFLRRACERIESAARRGMALPRYPPASDRNFPSAQAVSNSLWAFTTMKHPLAHALASLVVEITPRLIEAFDPEAEAQAARAEASAGPAAGEAETRRRKKTGGAFVAQTISNQLWAFGTLRRHPGDAHLDALARAVAKHVTHFKPQELTNVVWAYAALAHYPGDECMAAFEHDIARRARAGEWNPQNLSTLVMAVASFPHDDAASRASLATLMRALDHDDVVARVDSAFNFQDLANAAFGVAVAGGFASKLFAATWETTSRLEKPRLGGTDAYDSGALMLYNAKLLTEAVAPRVARSLPPLPAWLETQAEALWTKQADEGTVSEFQRDVSRRLRDLGVAHEVEAATADGKMSADIDIPLPRGHGSVALECDGPSHFCVNRTMGAVPLSRNGVRDALLGARGKRVVVVPWDEWAVREDEGVAEAWLRARLEAAGVVVGIS